LGDLVLLQDEINPVMSALLGNRLEVTALVIMNEGKIEQIGSVDSMREFLQRPPSTAG
jgi:hypothetical protein